MKSLAEKLKIKGIKVTPQRLSIYSMLTETDTHPNAETIHKSLESSHPSMSLATVYKTLSTLDHAGFIQTLNIGEECCRYDGNSNPHSHMVCNICHNVYDLSTTAQMENLRNELQAQTDFHIMSEQLYLYGVCKDCSNNRVASPII